MNEHYINARGESVFPYHVFKQLNYAAVCATLAKLPAKRVRSRRERRIANGSVRPAR